jgi:uncharacterized membrane protein
MSDAMVPHPIIVDFAVALLVVSVAFDLLASIVEERDLRVVSWWTLLLGTVAAALAVVSGFAAARLAGNDSPVVETIAWHRNLGIVTLACFGACTLWRLRWPASFPERFRDLYWALTAIGLGALLVTAYFGGILVFRLGVGFRPPGP